MVFDKKEAERRRHPDQVGPLKTKEWERGLIGLILTSGRLNHGYHLPIVREIREGFHFQLPDDAVGRIRKLFW